MEDISSIIKKRAKQIVVDGKRDELQIAQDELARYFPNSAKVIKIFNDGNILIEVNGSSEASNIYARQQELIQAIDQVIPTKVNGLRTKVR